MKLKYKFLLFNLAILFFVILLIVLQNDRVFNYIQADMIAVFDTNTVTLKEQHINDLFFFISSSLSELNQKMQMELSYTRDFDQKLDITNQYEEQMIKKLEQIKLSQETTSFYGFKVEEKRITRYIFNSRDKTLKDEFIDEDYLKDPVTNRLYLKEIKETAFNISSRKKYVEYYDQAKLKKLAFPRYYSNWNWIIVVEIDNDQILADIDHFKKNMLRQKQGFLSISLVISLLIFLLAFYFLFRTFEKSFDPLTQLNAHIQTAARGNFFILDNKIKIKGKDEIAKMVFNFEQLMKYLTYNLKEMNKIFTWLETLVEENKQINNELLEITTIDASAMTQVTQTLENSSSVIQSLTQNVNLSHSQLSNSTLIIKDGNRLIDVLIETVDQINSNADQIQNSINLLFEITDQTHLLALNATIEAAKAGNKGQGFSVVAEQIRKLADKSKETADSINNAIDTNNEHIQTTRNKILDSKRQYKDLSQIIFSLKDVVSEMINAVKQQESGTKEMNQLITKINSTYQRMTQVVKASQLNSSTITEATNSFFDFVNKFRYK